MQWKTDKRRLEAVYCDGSVCEMVKADTVTNHDILEMDVDVLVLAAMENQITHENAARIRAPVIAEGANGPISSAGDAALNLKGGPGPVPTTRDQVKPASHKLQRRLRDEPSSIYLFWRDRLDVIDKKFCGLRPTAMPPPSSRALRSSTSTSASRTVFAVLSSLKYARRLDLTSSGNPFDNV